MHLTRCCCRTKLPLRSNFAAKRGVMCKKNIMKPSFTLFIGTIVVIHVFFASLTTKELIEYPLIKKATKPFWFIFIWGIPIIGVIVFRCSNKLGWASGKTEANSIDGPSVEDE